MSHWSKSLGRKNACGDAIRWAASQPSRKRAWETCERGDWMLWIAGKLAATEAERKAVVLAACACARLALKCVPSGELRPLRCIEVTEAWCRGEATIEQVREARDADAAAAAYADAYAAADAAAYAAYAAYTAYAAAYAAAAYAACAAAAYAAAAYAYAAAGAYAAYAAARTPVPAECAGIVRRMVPMPELPLRKRAKVAA